MQDLFENVLREEEAALSGRLHSVFFQSLPSGTPLPLRISNPYPSVIAALKVLFELVYPYGSASFVWCDREIFEYFAKHNPVFFGGHFTRAELLELLGLTPALFLPSAICFGLICTARYVLSSLNFSSGGTKFEIFREQVGYLYILYYYARPGCLINCYKLCCSLSRVSYLSFARDSCSFPCRKL